jgi:hypothetical protein
MYEKIGPLPPNKRALSKKWKRSVVLGMAFALPQPTYGGPQFYKIHLQAVVKDCIFRTIPLAFWSGASNDLRNFRSFSRQKQIIRSLTTTALTNSETYGTQKRMHCRRCRQPASYRPAHRLTWHTQHVTDAHETWGIMSPNTALKNE